MRGCVFRCKFCYYPKAYDGLYFASRERVLAGLAHARERGAREVYILDPTLNQRRDFLPFLETLRDGNPDRSLELHAELRGEGITDAHARLMAAANFKEVELGLQSVGPNAQELMVLRTPALELADMLALLGEAEEVFAVEFDALPPPAVGPESPDAAASAGSPPRSAVLDLDRGDRGLPEIAAQAFTAALRARDIYRSLPAAERAVADFVRRNPFTTLQVTVDAGGGFPLDVLKRLRAAAARTESMYLDRFYEFTPGRPAAATRLAVLLPESLRPQLDPEWVEDALRHADVVWKARGAETSEITELERAGEWRWTAGGARESAAARGG